LARRQEFVKSLESALHCFPIELPENTFTFHSLPYEVARSKSARLAYPLYHIEIAPLSTFGEADAVEVLAFRSTARDAVRCAILAAGQISPP